MMRNIIACIALVCALGGAGFGENPFPWIGLEAVYFIPANRHPPGLFSTSRFETFRGLGLELGRVSGHHEISLDAHWVSASTNSWVEENAYAIIYMVTPRIAYRFFGRRTPYVGAGSGYCLIRGKPDILIRPEICITTHTISFEPFAGFDLRLTKRFGLKLEGRYQIVNPSEATFAQGLRGSAGAYVAFGEK